jgi:hypothetical protein
MANAPLQLDEDFELVECRTDVRITLSLPGRFKLASRRDMIGDRKEFPCRVVTMSCHSVALATPVSGEIGERVIANIEHFGKLEGMIVRNFDSGFLMDILASRNERLELAGKIEWYEKHKNHDAENQRRHVRIIPKNPYSTLVLADGTTTECLVKDVSASGVAVIADLIPDLGTPIAVGKVVGRVVRQFKDGFAVHFTELQDAQAVESLIARLS